MNRSLIEIADNPVIAYLSEIALGEIWKRSSDSESPYFPSETDVREYVSVSLARRRNPKTTRFFRNLIDSSGLIDFLKTNHLITGIRLPWGTGYRVQPHVAKKYLDVEQVKNSQNRSITLDYARVKPPALRRKIKL